MLENPSITVVKSQACPEKTHLCTWPEGVKFVNSFHRPVRQIVTNSFTFLKELLVGSQSK